MDDYKCPSCGGDLYDVNNDNKKCCTCGTTYPDYSKSKE
mgnify:CR=1 FL=1